MIVGGNSIASSTDCAAPLEVIPVLMAGGSGTRLWPVSRQSYPKQFLALAGDETLLQATLLRTAGLESKTHDKIRVNKPILLCSEEHRFLVSEQLAEIQQSVAAILLEPIGKNTAPALTLAALAATDTGEDPLLLVMPADHVITNTGAFHDALVPGIEATARGHIVTFGIVPTHPETQFGYIKTATSWSADVFDIESFVEKPDLETAKAYCASSQYLWNSGLFVVRASDWLVAINRYQSGIAAACAKAWQDKSTDGQFVRIGAKAFHDCPANSIDYAVMEPLSGRASSQLEGLGGVVVALNAGWSDVGSWGAVMDSTGERDVKGNLLVGDAYCEDSTDSLFYSTSRLVAGIGVQDTVVVETADAVVVANKNAAPQIGNVVQWLKSQGREEGTSHIRVHRPWGYYEQLDCGPLYQVKKLMVKPAGVLSLQMHHHRAEHWIVVRGTASVTRGDDEFLLSENQSTYIPLGVTHRLVNHGALPLEVVEVQSGTYLGEDDIVRFEDQYERVEQGT